MAISYANLSKGNCLASDSNDPNRDRTPYSSSYSIELRLVNRLVVIVGAGPVAMRKIPDLLAAGARVQLIDPRPLPDILQSSQLTHLQRKYQVTDFHAAHLVFAATNCAETNFEIAQEAAKLKILCCRVDSSEGSDFMTPARILRPPITVSVSTGGGSPAMAAILRDMLNEKIPPVWQTATELASAIRRKLLTEQLQIPYNQQVLLLLIEEGLLACLEQSDHAATDRLLHKHFGAEFSLNTLSFSLPEGTP